ncbi:unnamed protein product [Coregonus sp. 'balchen']|nr:unnamed protein product [Coregonus sp. 'balchen']
MGQERTRSSTTTMVIESKNGEAGQPLVRVSKRTVTDDLYTTFSSPMAWILVLALVVTWSCVAIIMFDLMDYKGLTGVPPPPAVRKAIKEAGRSRGKPSYYAFNFVVLIRGLGGPY